MSASPVFTRRPRATGLAPWLSIALVLLAGRAAAAGASSHHPQGVTRGARWSARAGWSSHVEMTN